MSILSALLETSAYAAALYLAVTLFKLVFSKKLSSALHFALWFLVLARLCVPVTIESGFHFFTMEREQAAVDLLTAQNGGQGAYRTPQTLPREAAGAPAGGAAPQAKPENAPAASGVKLPALTWESALLALWALGLFARLAALLISGVRLSRAVRRNGLAPDERLLRIYADCARRLNLRRAPQLKLLGRISSPALTVSPRPVVVMPLPLVERFSDEQLTLALLHELSHFKRGDHLIALLMRALEAAYWFNPFVWLTGRALSRDMETACDGAVTALLGGEGRKAYALTLLTLFSGERRESHVLGMALSAAESDAQRRIRGVFRSPKSKWGVRAAALCLSFVLLLSCFTTACQPTPEKNIVVDRREDYVETVVTAESFVALDAPARAESAFKNPATGLTVRFDADVTVPVVDTYAILEVRERFFTEEEYLRLIVHFAPLSEWTEEVAFTREEWLARIGAYRKSGYDAELPYMTEQMNAAPEAFVPSPLSLASAASARALRASRANGDGTYALLELMPGGKGFYYGSYSEANCLSESALSPNDALLADFVGEPALKTEDALERALAILDVAGLSEVVLIKTEKSCAYVYGVLAAKGYELTFAHGNNGLNGIDGMEGATYGGDGLPLPVLTAPWADEIIKVGVYENGMVYADVRNPVDYEKELVRNVVLLAFDEVESRVREHLLATYFYLPERVGDAAVVVTGMELCTALVVAKDDPDAGRLIPAWRVSFSVTRGGGAIAEPADPRYFSALDGAYIEPRITGEYLG